MRTIRTPQKRGKILAILRRTGNLTEAARTVGIGRRTLYEWQRDEPAFKADCDAAMEDYASVLEAEADRRAVEGYVGRTWVDADGNLQEQRYFSDTLLIFRLKGLKPKVYRERVHHSGDADEPLEVRIGRQLGTHAQQIRAALHANGHALPVAAVIEGASDGDDSA